MAFYTDRSTISKRSRTPEGYLRVDDVRIARVGVQDYIARELLDESAPAELKANPDSVIKLYRPPSEVFDTESMQSFVNKSVTNNHPTVMVDATNVKNLQVGFSRDTIRQEGDFLVADLVIQDEQTIKDVESGKVEVSNGYIADLKWESGVTPEGIKYDAIQTNIRGNHIAIVQAGRAGSSVRLSDKTPTNNGDKTMPKKLIVDGITVEFSDQGAEVVEKLQGQITSFKQQLTDTEAGQSTQLTDLESKVEKLEGQLEAEKGKQLTDAQIDELVASRSKLIGDAKSVLGDEDLAGQSELEIKKAVVAKLNDSIDISDRSEAFVDGVYESLMASRKKGDAQEFSRQLNDEDGTKDNSSTVLKDAQEAFKKRNLEAGRKPLSEVM